MIREIWKDITGYEGLYQVSNQGHVQSMDRCVSTQTGPRNYKGKILRQSKSNTGYLVVSLYKDTKQVDKLVHRLVLEAFVGICPKGMECCHDNGKQQDARLSNLRWDTPSNNNKDKRQHGTNRGKRVRRSDGIEFNSLCEAAEAVQGRAGDIRKACQGKLKTSCGYNWRYI